MRRVLTIGVWGLAGIVFIAGAVGADKPGSAVAGHGASHETSMADPEAALAELVAGNARYVQGRPACGGRDLARRVVGARYDLDTGVVEILQ